MVGAPAGYLIHCLGWGSSPQCLSPSQPWKWSLAELSEGDHLHLICSLEGTPLRQGNLLRIVTTDRNHRKVQIPAESRKDSGRYHCEAVNPANNTVYSDLVDIEGKKITPRDLLFCRWNTKVNRMRRLWANNGEKDIPRISDWETQWKTWNLSGWGASRFHKANIRYPLDILRRC